MDATYILNSKKEERGFIFDLNGTMIDDMEFHLDVWYEIVVHALGSKLNKEEVKAHMYGKSQELLVRIFGEQRFTIQQLDEISNEKERHYQERYRPHLKLIPGLSSFLENAYAAKIKMALGSAAIPYNIDFVLDHLNIRHYFDAIVCANDVAESKPHPETFLMAAQRMHLKPSSCIVFEDAPKGVEAAMHAGMKCVVLTTMHDESYFQSYDNVLMFIRDFNELQLDVTHFNLSPIVPKKI